jgi:hypothetical protein
MIEETYKYLFTNVIMNTTSVLFLYFINIHKLVRVIHPKEHVNQSMIIVDGPDFLFGSLKKISKQ